MVRPKIIKTPLLHILNIDFSFLKYVRRSKFSFQLRSDEIVLFYINSDSVQTT